MGTSTGEGAAPEVHATNGVPTAVTRERPPTPRLPKERVILIAAPHTDTRRHVSTATDSDSRPTVGESTPVHCAGTPRIRRRSASRDGVLPSRG
jgi:hypothetical protein